MPFIDDPNMKPSTEEDLKKRAAILNKDFDLKAFNEAYKQQLKKEQIKEKRLSEIG